MKNRLSKLQALMTKQRLDAVLISSVSNITYLTNFSHFSQHEREAFLLITQNQNYILTDGRYSTAVKNKIKNFKLIEVSSKLTFEKALKNLAKKNKIKKLGIEEDNLTVKEHKTLLSSRLSPKGAWRDLYSLRITKDKTEIYAIEEACQLGDKTFKYILNKIKLGVSEKQIAFDIEFFIKKAGADISFPPIVAFGANSAIPHHKTNNQRLATSGQFVLLDFGVKLNNYCSDMTRTVIFGKATAEQKRMYQTVLEAQKKSIEELSHLGGDRMGSSEEKSGGIKAMTIDKIARNYIISKNYKTIPHSVGHGIGLEVHESPRLSPKSKDILKPGMVFTIEPGIYLPADATHQALQAGIPNLGGIRIEDVVVLEKTGFRLLTNSPKEIFELH